MPGRRAWGCVPLLALGLVLVLSGCAGKAGTKDEPKTQGTSRSTAPGSGQSSGQCRSQWHDVADSVLGLDQETHPSSLASRWVSVIATIQYYETTSSDKDCRRNIETQVKAIAALRQLNDRLRPYDMSYQLQEVSPSVDLYLHDPLPSPARDANHKLVRPPGKIAVQRAQQTLSRYAAAADADLQPGWAQLTSVDIGDTTALDKAIADLDQLAQDSSSWQACEHALQVIVAAERAQEGLVGAPAEEPTG